MKATHSKAARDKKKATQIANGNYNEEEKETVPSIHGEKEDRREEAMEEGGGGGGRGEKRRGREKEEKTQTNTTTNKLARTETPRKKEQRKTGREGEGRGGVKQTKKKKKKEKEKRRSRKYDGTHANTHFAPQKQQKKVPTSDRRTLG